VETVLYPNSPAFFADEITAPLQASRASDAALLAAVQAGDEHAMAELYDSYSRIVYSVALRVLRDPSAAEDVLQDVFLRLWKRPAGFAAARGSLSGWFSAVARNRSIDVVRQRRPMDDVDDLPLASGVNVLKDVEDSMLAARIRMLVAALPLPQQSALEMAYFGGWTHREIAAKTQTPLGTVKTRIRTALLCLRESLEA